MRSFELTRKTAETDITLALHLDGSGLGTIATGVGFLDHMLTLLARHAQFDLTVLCNGDTYVDDHHTVEDIGICLGEALREALEDKRGINRYGSVVLPMDEALVLCAVDISGRSHLEYALTLPAQKVGTFDSELAEEFFAALTRSAGITLHLRQISGTNTHHIIEAAFKATARALRTAVAVDAQNPDEIPSTKGVL